MLPIQILGKNETWYKFKNKKECTCSFVRSHNSYFTSSFVYNT